MAEAPVITRAEERPRVAPRRRRRRRLRRGLQPLPWLAPSLVLILGIVVYPVFEMARTSLFDVNISGLTTRFVGLRNYGRILTDGDLAHILSNSAKWVGLIVGLTMLISLALAQLLNQQFPGRRWVRWALIVPWATSLVITASAWKWMLNFYYGIVNAALMKVGLLDAPRDWLGDPSTSFYAMVLVGIIASIPFTTYVILAGLQGIPGELYEAASVDGATAWRTYLGIVLPLLRPALVVAAVLNAIYTFNSFPVIWIMTGGGPGTQTDTTATWVYKLAFKDRAVDEAAALSVLNVCLLFAVTFAYMTWLRRREGVLS